MMYMHYRFAASWMSQWGTISLKVDERWNRNYSSLIACLQFVHCLEPVRNALFAFPHEDMKSVENAAVVREQISASRFRPSIEAKVTATHAAGLPSSVTRHMSALFQEMSSTDVPSVKLSEALASAVLFEVIKSQDSRWPYSRYEGQSP